MLTRGLCIFAVLNLQFEAYSVMFDFVWIELVASYVWFPFMKVFECIVHIQPRSQYRQLGHKMIQNCPIINIGIQDQRTRRFDSNKWVIQHASHLTPCKKHDVCTPWDVWEVANSGLAPPTYTRSASLVSCMWQLHTYRRTTPHLFLSVNNINDAYRRSWMQLAQLIAKWICEQC